MTMMEVKLEGLALDMTTNTPVVILAPSEIDKVIRHDHDGSQAGGVGP